MVSGPATVSSGHCNGREWQWSGSPYHYARRDSTQSSVLARSGESGRTKISRHKGVGEQPLVLKVCSMAICHEQLPGNGRWYDGRQYGF